jgi:hypothetical protein
MNDYNYMLKIVEIASHISDQLYLTLKLLHQYEKRRSNHCKLLTKNCYFKHQYIQWIYKQNTSHIATTSKNNYNYNTVAIGGKQRRGDD